jgi:hypothetical protein
MVKTTGQAMIIVAVLPALMAVLSLTLPGITNGATVLLVAGLFWAVVLVVLGVLIAQRRSLVAAAVACLLAGLGSIGSVVSVFFAGRGNIVGLVFWAFVLGLGARHFFKIVTIIRGTPR